MTKEDWNIKIKICDENNNDIVEDIQINILDEIHKNKELWVKKLSTVFLDFTSPITDDFIHKYISTFGYDTDYFLSECKQLLFKDLDTNNILEKVFNKYELTSLQSKEEELLLKKLFLPMLDNCLILVYNDFIKRNYYKTT